MHIVEVDQSGKVEQTGPTAVAMANGIHKSVRLEDEDKQAILKELRQRKPGWQDAKINIYVFAVLLYLLLKDDIEQLDLVIIDPEWDKQGNKIKEHLMNLLRRRGITVYRDQITFTQIGRKSPAHTLAYRVFKGITPPDKTITAEEVLAEFGEGGK